MYKLKRSARNTDNSSIGFDRDRGRRQVELTNNKTQRGKFHIRIMLRVALGFAKKSYIWLRIKINFNKKF